ncbi:uncharacterized protein LOC110704649 [Chenopodium quinoa]|uniref:uncharacterized protein LOC110704649 n=1 Tax=Chenopodium quinoa TaxID=63459 RepID=UPI000B76F556|nr:uncharacterized protein LOC110704649 [Chenopodium quinoa]
MKNLVPESMGGSQNKEQSSPASYIKATAGESKTLRNEMDMEGLDDDDVSDDDIPLDCDSEDEDCPTILLTKEGKRRLRAPWRNALIIKLFDKRMSYAILVKRLRLKWQLKGDIALTDVGHDYYVVRFNNMEDYDWVLSQGPWLIGDSYLTIRKWEPNFVADEAPIKKLNAWVRIPQLSVEYFDKKFLYEIGSKIGKVVKIDRNTESRDRGQYIRFCIEVDLTRPLLSRFKMNGRIWRIQYEGLKQICFKCGHLEHKEDACTLFKKTAGGEGSEKAQGAHPVVGQGDRNDTKRPKEQGKYGTWMLVQRPQRKTATKKVDQGKNKPNVSRLGKQIAGSNSIEEGSSKSVRGNNNSNAGKKVQGNVASKQGSRFSVLNHGD